MGWVRPAPLGMEAAGEWGGAGEPRSTGMGCTRGQAHPTLGAVQSAKALSEVMPMIQQLLEKSVPCILASRNRRSPLCGPHRPLEQVQDGDRNPTGWDSTSAPRSRPERLPTTSFQPHGGLCARGIRLLVLDLFENIQGRNHIGLWAWSRACAWAGAAKTVQPKELGCVSGEPSFFPSWDELWG